MRANELLAIRPGEGRLAWLFFTYFVLLLVGALIAVGATAFALRRYLEV